MATGMEMMLNMLFKQFGIDKEEVVGRAFAMQAAFSELVDAMKRIDARLARIEQKLEISGEAEISALITDERHVENG